MGLCRCYGGLVKRFFLLILLAMPALAFSEAYQKATNAEENVKNKRFPKAGKFEISAPAIGLILNESYIDSYLVHGAFTYFINESWGLGIEGAWVTNVDKVERYCIEHFYNDPYGNVSETCPQPGEDIYAPLKSPSGAPLNGANFGPAYVPIRELTSLIFLTGVWNPIYGKQLAFLKFTSYFDIFTTFGIGVASSLFYPESLYLRDGVLSRGPVAGDSSVLCPTNVGVCPSNPNVTELIGANGRPDAEAQVDPMFTIGIGQKLYAAGRTSRLRNLFCALGRGRRSFLMEIFGV